MTSAIPVLRLKSLHCDDLHIILSLFAVQIYEFHILIFILKIARNTSGRCLLRFQCCYILLYIPIHRPIHNVVEPILLTVLEGQPMLRVALPPSCQPWQKKLRKSANDYAQ